MKKLLLIAVLMLSGCQFRVTEGELNLCIQACEKNEGINSIIPEPFSAKCFCKNTATFTVVAK